MRQASSPSSSLVDTHTRYGRHVISRAGWLQITFVSRGMFGQRCAQNARVSVENPGASDGRGDAMSAVSYSLMDRDLVLVGRSEQLPFQLVTHVQSIGAQGVWSHMQIHRLL